MIQFEYNDTMKRHDVRVPYSLAGVESTLTVGHIEKEEDREAKITVYRELSVNLLRQIILRWDEQEHMEEMRAKREKTEKEEFNELLETK